MALSATRVPKAAADKVNFIDIRTLHSLIGETGMARTGIRRCQIETGSRAPLKKFRSVRTRPREPSGAVVLPKLPGGAGHALMEKLRRGLASENVSSFTTYASA